jgi:hypothetical protein
MAATGAEHLQLFFGQLGLTGQFVILPQTDTAGGTCINVKRDGVRLVGGREDHSLKSAP